MNFQFQISMREHTNQLQKFSPQLLPEFNIPLLRSSERGGLVFPKQEIPKQSAVVFSNFHQLSLRMKKKRRREN